MITNPLRPRSLSLVASILLVSSACLADLPDDRWRYDRRDTALQPRSSARENMEAVERARDRGAGRIVDQQTWELDRVRDAREGRREFEVVEEHRDRTLRLERRDREQPRERAARDQVRSDVRREVLPLAPHLDDQRALRDAKRAVIRRFNELSAAEAKELAALRKKFSSDKDAARLREAEGAARRRYETERERALDDYVRTRDRLLGLPELSDSEAEDSARTRPARAEEASPEGEPPPNRIGVDDGTPTDTPASD